MKVSQVKFESIRSGDHVLSPRGTFGRIVNKWIDPTGHGEFNPDNYWILIKWNSGNNIYAQHNILNEVTYLS